MFDAVLCYLHACAQNGFLYAKPKLHMRVGIYVVLLTEKRNKCHAIVPTAFESQQAVTKQVCLSVSGWFTVNEYVTKVNGWYAINIHVNEHATQLQYTGTANQCRGLN